MLIIGGGIAGLLCAHELRRAGLDCVLVESGKICGGVTGNTTAKITAQHGLIYHQLSKRFGDEKAGLYLRANLEALERFRTLSRDADCQFEARDSLVYSLDDPAALEAEMETLSRLGAPAEFEPYPELPFSAAGAVRFRDQAQFHPLKFLAAIAPELPIYENTKVLALAPGRAVTNGGSIWADKMIVATHFPFINKHGSYFLKMYQHRSYVLALENTPGVEAMYLDEDEKGLSLRQSGSLLLLGGGSHRTGKKGGAWRELEDFAARHYPGSREVSRWATQDCMTLDGVPYIGQYSARTPGLFVATGFNKWGMSSAMAAAGLLCDLVQEKPNPYAELFSPSRSILHPQLALNAAGAVLNLLTPTAPRCPHMGCALKYNRTEHSWDCPCHGSRFTRDGRLLDGPATGDKENLKKHHGE